MSSNYQQGLVRRAREIERLLNSSRSTVADTAEEGKAILARNYSILEAKINQLVGYILAGEEEASE